MKYEYVITFLFMLTTMVLPQNPNDVIINEYNDDGGATGTKNGIDMSQEWVEILVVNGPVDLRNWYITDEEWSVLSTSSYEGKLQIADSASFASVATGTYVVIIKGSGTDDTDASDGNLVLYSDNANISSKGSFSLALAGDGLTLVKDDDQIPGEKDAGEVPVDYVSWGGELDVPTGLTWSSAISGTEDEDSYFSNGANFNNDVAANWVTNAESGGSLTNRTPGAANPGQNDASLPVDLASFRGWSERGTIQLQWTTECEFNNLGFIVERREDIQANEPWQEIADYRTCSDLQGQGSTSRWHNYRYQDRDVSPGNVYTYRLSDVDINGRIRNIATTQVKARTPHITLKTPRPNPFNPITNIPLEVGTPSHIRVAVVDLMGNEVTVLVDAQYLSGDYSLIWDGTDRHHQPVSSGVYFLAVQENGVLQTNHPKLVLLR